MTLSIDPKQVTALIGPSGCGKSAFIRTLNRMDEGVRGARIEPQILLMDKPCSALDPVSTLRRLAAVGPTRKIFTTPDDEHTEAYITGRFG